MLRIRRGESGCSVALGFHGGHAGPRELLRLQVCFSTHDVRLGCGEIRRCYTGRAGRLGCGDCLPSVAHLLHGSPGASDHAGHTDEYSKEAQHRVRGH